MVIGKSKKIVSLLLSARIGAVLSWRTSSFSSFRVLSRSISIRSDEIEIRRSPARTINNKWLNHPPRHFCSLTLPHSSSSSLLAATTTDGVDSWAAPHALLFSSFTEGVQQSQEGKAFIERVLKEKLLRDMIQNLRLLYIPTALYAFKKNSHYSPEEQRQLARVDAKLRRDQIVLLLQEIFHDSIPILAVTLDLEDGSIEQPAGSSIASDFPVTKNTTAVFEDWSPHMVYVDGGNTFWLHHCLCRNNNHYWDAILKLCSASSSSPAALYCGRSAGSIVAGSYVETATWKGWDDPSIVPGMEQPQDWKGVRGLNLFNGSIFPHYSQDWTELVNQKKTDFNGTLVCLAQYELLAVNGREKQNNIFSAAA